MPKIKQDTAKNTIKNTAVYPQVSVIMTTYNRAHTVAKAIDSILNQTFKDFEFIIVNDGSTDGTQSILEHYAQKEARIKIILQTNGGPARARNQGVKYSKGKYIAFMDDDDLSLPERLGEQYKFLKQEVNSDIEGCVCHYKVLTRNKKNPNQITKAKICTPTTERSRYSEVDLKNIRVQKLSLSPMTMITKSAFIKCGRYRPFFDYGEDFDFTLRYQERYRIGVVPQNLYEYTSPYSDFGNNRTTSVHDPLKGIKYITAAYISAWFRRNQNKDPIGQESTLEDVINNIAFLPICIRRHILFKCLDHYELDVLMSAPKLSSKDIIRLIRFLQRLDQKKAFWILRRKRRQPFRLLRKQGKRLDTLHLHLFRLKELFSSFSANNKKTI